MSDRAVCIKNKVVLISIVLSKWYYESHIYIAVTYYKYLRNSKIGCGCHCCAPFDFLPDHPDCMCISTNLNCDGVSNCGQFLMDNQESLQFQDEKRVKTHRNSVLVSLVSYIFPTIILLLCLSWFLWALIKCSWRSGASLAEAILA